MIESYNYRGDPNIGFYATLTNSYAVIPPEFNREEFLNVDTIETYIAGTRLVGLFTAGNSNCILLPSNLKPHEEKKFEDAGINYRVINSRDNALGNLVLATDKGAVISEKLSEYRDEIENALDVHVEIGTVAGLPGPGVCGAANSHGVLLHREATEEEAEQISEAVDVEDVDIGTVNMGSPYIGSGIVGNDENILVGGDSTGPEIGRIDRVLVRHE
jgi:translation initiation factor 6